MSTLVSACLLGFACRHDGRDKRDPRLLAALSDEEVVPVCPEIAGGLGVPRQPAFLDGARIVDARGREVTDRFAAGAAAAVLAARAHGCSRAILKQHSPSCGTRSVGTAQGRAPGLGVAAAALSAAGLELLSEDEV